MSVTSLNEALTQDDWTEALTIAAPMASAAILTFNKPVYMQEGRGLPSPSFTRDPVLIPPGMTVSLTHPTEALRFRSAVSGQPGRVTVIPTFGPG